DTYKADTADAAIAAGADMINDVWGFKHEIDDRDLQAQTEGDLPLSPMAAVAARHRCPVILMHNRRTRDYTDFWTDFLADLRTSQALAKRAGIDESQIWLDPGFGFAKNPAQNLEALKHLD